jgi:hypothetical protein
LRPIPTWGQEEAILEFKDEWTEEKVASNPLQEAKLILSWLSVVLRSCFSVGASELNSVPTPREKGVYRQFSEPIDPPQDLQGLFDKLCALEDKLLRTYLRACDLYHLAAQVIDDRPSLANFLLVSAVECLSSVTTPSSSFRESFLTFIKQFCPRDTLGIDVADDTVDALLTTIQDYRSQYAHGGKDVPVASLAADKHGLIWVRHFDDGKEELAPSISWFESVVRTTLMEFFRRQAPGTIPPRKREKLVELAVSLATVHLKAKKPIVAGQLVTRDDIDLQ